MTVTYFFKQSRSILTIAPNATDIALFLCGIQVLHFCPALVVSNALRRIFGQESLDPETMGQTLNPSCWNPSPNGEYDGYSNRLISGFGVRPTFPRETIDMHGCMQIWSNTCCMYMYMYMYMYVYICVCVCQLMSSKDHRSSFFHTFTRRSNFLWAAAPRFFQFMYIRGTGMEADFLSVPTTLRKSVGRELGRQFLYVKKWFF